MIYHVIWYLIRFKGHVTCHMIFHVRCHIRFTCHVICHVICLVRCHVIGQMSYPFHRSCHLICHVIYHVRCHIRFTCNVRCHVVSHVISCQISYPVLSSPSGNVEDIMSYTSYDIYNVTCHVKYHIRFLLPPQETLKIGCSKWSAWWETVSGRS